METSRSVGNFPWIPDRPSSSGSQFPSRWATLPQISGGSPRPGDSQIVPYKGGDRPIEGRLAVAEQSNRALLDEVARLQSESKSQTRRMEEVLHEERNYRKQLENAVRSSNDIIAQLASRVQRAEDRLRDEHSTVAALVNQTKGMESAIVGNQKEMVNRKDVQATRMQELRNQLDESLRAKDQLERVTYEMVDEIRQLKARVDTQAMDFSQVASELKNSNRRLEDETRQTRMSSMAKTGENNNTVQVANHQLRAQLESRLSELRDVLVDLRKKQEIESQERRSLEQRVQLKLGEVSSTVSEQDRKRDEALFALEQQNREKGHMSDTEKFRLQSQIMETNDEIQRKMTQREMKIKEDVQKSISNLENLLRQEQEDRLKFERAIRDAMDERYDALKKLQDQSLDGQKESAKNDKKKQNETLHKLNDGLQLLEKEIQEYRSRQEKVLMAEVSSRKQHETATKEEMRAIREKIDVATATMQQAISGITLQMATQKETIREELKGMMDDGDGSTTRNLADMDSRLLSLNQRVTQAEETLEAKIQAVSDGKEAAEVNTQNVKEKVETITIWQEMAQNDLKDLQEQNKKKDEEIEALKEQHSALKTELETKFNADIEVKIKELEEKLEDLRPGSYEGNDSGIKGEELENLQKGIRKLAESIQTVKTVLGMKIQSEQKGRVEGVKNLQEEVEKLKEQLEPLLKNMPEPAVFIKPEESENLSNKEVESQAPEINKWSVYNTYRWLKIKDGLKKSEKDKDKEPEKDEKKEEEKKDDDDEKKNDDDDKKKDDDKKDDDAKKKDEDDDKKDDKKDDDNDDDKKKKKNDDDDDKKKDDKKDDDKKKDDDDDDDKKKKKDDDDDDEDDKKKKKKDDDDD